MKQTRTRRHVQLVTELHESAWAEADIFVSIRNPVPKPGDYRRLVFDWGF
jgi:hypothetical protein